MKGGKHFILLAKEKKKETHNLSLIDMYGQTSIVNIRAKVKG